MSSLFIMPQSRPIGEAGTTLPFGLLRFYLQGTLTPADVYDADGDVISQPVTADVTGAFPTVYLSDLISYRARLFNAAGVEQDDWDPYPGITASTIGFIQSGTGAVSRSVQSKLRDAVSVFDFIPVALQADISDGTSTEDVTTYIQAALTAHLTVYFPDGLFNLTAALSPREDQAVILSPDTTIEQTTANTPIFFATNIDGLKFYCNTGTLRGEGTWSAGWTGNGGHLDEAFRLQGCENFLIDSPRIENCGHAGICLIGGSGTINNPVIVGISPPSSSNFHNGIYLNHSTTYGGVRLKVYGGDISATAMGVAEEIEAGADEGDKLFVDMFIHDITGQHAFYLQAGNSTIANAVLLDLELAGIKVQATSATNLELSNFVFTGVRAKGLGSNMFEIAHISGTGGVSNVQIDGQGDDVLVGLALSGEVSKLKADLVLTDLASAMVTTLDGTNDIEAHIFATGMSGQGISINSTNTSNIRIYPTLRNVNTSAAGGNQYGIIVAQATAAVDLFDPDITDTGGNMTHALGATASGAKIVVRGRPKYRGYTTSVVNAVAGAMISTGGVQTLTGAGAVNLTTAFTELVTTAADALTLADGVEGQAKTIRMKTDGGDGTLTPANLASGTTITFSAVGQYVDLIFTSGEWWVLGGTAVVA
jgi:hypothetical protein